MTDAEMVKAMEICKDKEIPCDDCPLVGYGDCGEISRQYFYDRFKQLQSENAALRERLEKAVELPSIRKHFTKDGVVYELVYKDDLGFVHTKWCDRDDVAEASLAELKGGEK